jgi:hypothetical protein
MPPLLCPSPDLIDHSFPRSVQELERILGALGRLTEGIQSGEFTFLLTEPLLGMIRDSNTTFDWTKTGEFPRLQIVYHLLSQIGLQPPGVETINLATVTGHIAHPIPSQSRRCTNTAAWADEIGRLYCVHETCREARKPPFVGIGCTSAFSGSALDVYNNPLGQPTLPLVGPNEVGQLCDSDTWDVTDQWSDRTVTFDQAYANLRMLGGRVCTPSGSSHYQVKFKGERTWPLDSNNREVPERHLKELAEIAKLDLSVLKYILIVGRWPRKVRLLRTN